METLKKIIDKPDEVSDVDAVKVVPRSPGAAKLHSDTKGRIMKR